MARNGVKTGGRDIRPGQVLNPLGSRAHDPQLIALRNLTKENLKEVLQLVLTRNVDELQRMAEEPATPVFKAAAATAALRAYRSGDWSFMEGPLARVIGKVKEEIEISGELTLRAKYQDMTDDDLKRILEERAAKTRLLLE